MGAAGCVELALAARACRDRRLPGTATLIEVDEALQGLNLPTRACRLGAGAVLKTSLGFGGHLAAVVLESA